MSVKSTHLLLVFCKIFHPDLCISARVAESYKCLCGRSPFQLLATSFARLPGLPRQSCSGDFSGDLSRVRTSGSLRGRNLDCGVDERAVPSRFVFLCNRKQTGNLKGTSFIRKQSVKVDVVIIINAGKQMMTLILTKCIKLRQLPH
jgi:hypothetical protein